MKKLMALVLALVMVLLVCVGCGDKSKDKVIEPEAVASELVVAAQCEDEAAAQALESSMKQYLSDLKMEADRYQPEEVARVDKAVISRNGCAVVLCVSGDDRAADTVEAWLK